MKKIKNVKNIKHVVIINWDEDKIKIKSAVNKKTRQLHIFVNLK